MTFYPDTTLLPPSPMDELDYIIFEQWNRHLELELVSPYNAKQTEQHLEITAAIIDYWEEVITKVNTNEIRKRRLNSCQNS